LFFRRKEIIAGDAIRNAIAGASLVSSSVAGHRDLSEKLAGDIMEKIVQGGDFWQQVYEPFSRSDISRDVVRMVVEKARSAAGRQMPSVARYLRAVTDVMDDDEKRKILYKFKNFLYKTVRI
jgi:hypothetical protein